MAKLKIITEEEPLRKKSRPITEITDRIRTLLSDMLETMRDADGVGLAAPQVGVLRRAVVIEVTEGEVLYLSKTYVVRTLPSRFFKAHVSLAYEKIGAEELLVNRIEERIEIPSLS